MRYSKLLLATALAGIVAAPAAFAHSTSHAGLAKYQSMDRWMNDNSVESPVVRHGWQNRISVGGLLNVDGRWSSRDLVNPQLPSFATGDKVEDASDLNVNNANLFFDARINNFTRAHVGLAYVRDFRFSEDAERQSEEAYAVMGDKGSVHNVSVLGVDEAYITFNCFAKTPFFMRLGKQYVPFGHYDDAYPLTYGLAQLLSQTRATAAEVGFVLENGLYGMAFAFNGQGSNSADFDSRRIRNWGGKLGFASHVSNVSYDLDASYLRDVRDVDLYADYPGMKVLTEGTTREAGVALHGDAQVSGFTFAADYVKYLEDLSPTLGSGSAVWAYDLDGSFAFKTLGHHSAFGLGYQASGDGEALAFGRPSGLIHALPKRRYLAYYTFNIARDADMRVEYDHNDDYGEAEGPASYKATDNKTNVLSVRVGVKF